MGLKTSFYKHILHTEWWQISRDNYYCAFIYYSTELSTYCDPRGHHGMRGRREWLAEGSQHVSFQSSQDVHLVLDSWKVSTKWATTEAWIQPYPTCRIENHCMYSVYCLEMLKGYTHHSCHFWKGNRANSSVSNTVHYILLQFLQSVYFFYLKYEDRNCTVTLHIFRNCAKNERWYSVFYTELRSCETQMQNELPEK